MDQRTAIDDRDLLRAQAQLIRDRQGLGRSPALASLFDYLVETSLQGRAPKELEVADAVFGRGQEFDTVQDASVRVNAFRLRKKLDEFYADKGSDQPLRVVLLKGQYRLAVRNRSDAAVEAEEPCATAQAGWRSIASAVLATLGVCILCGAFLWYYLWRPDASDRAVEQARLSRLWSGIITDNKPITVVIGDYYMIGQMGDDGKVQRLVRDFRVNSRHDLDMLKVESPGSWKQYRDLGLRYYPIGVATAVRDIVPVLRSAEQRLKRPVQIIPASGLTPSMLRNRSIVYIGYFSGLGSLRDPLFRSSGFAIGRSYSEVIEKKSKRLVGSAGSDATQDFGYVATFAGPNQNRIVIIAGTGDAALMQAADYAWRAPVLREIDSRIGNARSFEALWSVETLGGENLAGKLVSARPIEDRGAWRGTSPQAFPDAGEPPQIAETRPAD